MSDGSHQNSADAAAAVSSSANKQEKGSVESSKVGSSDSQNLADNHASTSQKRSATEERAEENKRQRGSPDAGRDQGFNGERKFPKRKVACLIGYCGTGFHGMQINPPNKTIEGEFFKALVEVEAISKDNSTDAKKSSMMRAARTDKGVHAAGNLISVKMAFDIPDLVKKVNQVLPPTIRLWGVSRTNKSFDARKLCGSRVYEYLLPSYALIAPDPESPLAKNIQASNTEFPDAAIPADPEGEAWWSKLRRQEYSEGLTPEAIASLEAKIAEVNARIDPNKKPDYMAELNPEDYQIWRRKRVIENTARRSYRVSSERLERIREAFQKYKGVHNFHNFTLGKSYKDPSSRRVMKDLSVSDPKIINGTEWLSIKIHGQSFMLHQIRKMVSLAVLLVRCNAPLDRINQAFRFSRVNIPKAPSLGLLLERPVYESYNSKLKGFGYSPIDFTPFEEEIEAFKMREIYDKIYAVEAAENTLHGFLSFIDFYTRDDSFDYLTARGIKDQFPELTSGLSQDKDPQEAKKELKARERQVDEEESKIVTEIDPFGRDSSDDDTAANENNEG